MLCLVIDCISSCFTHVIIVLTDVSRYLTRRAHEENIGLSKV